jgi:hypothetical protein
MPLVPDRSISNPSALNLFGPLWLAEPAADAAAVVSGGGDASFTRGTLEVGDLRRALAPWKSFLYRASCGLAFEDFGLVIATGTGIWLLG